MRLIDGKALADEILGEIYERGQASGLWEQQLEIGALTYRDIEFANGYDKALDGVYRKISNTPTVEAIPIEWIEARLKKAVDFTHSKVEGKFIDNGCVVSVVSANFTANVLFNLLEDWRKENEIDRR